MSNPANMPYIFGTRYTKELRHEIEILRDIIVDSIPHPADDYYEVEDAEQLARQIIEVADRLANIAVEINDSVRGATW